MNIDLSLVVPVYYEEDCIKEFIAQCQAVLNKMNIEYEFIFVDDGSQDSTVEIIKEYGAVDKRIKLVQFSYNHGKQSAVSAGIFYASGDYLLYMDPDLQDPPSEIPNFFNKIKEEKLDLVFGVRIEKADSWINKIYSSLFWNYLNKFTGLEVPKNLAVMRIFTKEFADEFLKYSEQNRFIEGIFMKIHKSYDILMIDQLPRFAGKTKFSFKKKMNLAFDAMYDFSELPLKLATRFGLIFTLLGILYLLGIVFAKFYILEFQSGWPSVVGIIIICTGVQIFFLGIVATYIGRIYKEVKRRPLYSVSKLMNLDEKTSDNRIW